MAKLVSRLPHNQTFVIGKALDLTGLNDIHIHLEGEIRVSNPFRNRTLSRDLTEIVYG